MARLPLQLLRLLVSAMAGLMLCACDDRPSTKNVLAHPDLLGTLPNADLNFGGVKLGDPKTAVPIERISSQGKTAVATKDGCQFNLNSEDKITSVRIPDAVARKMQIDSPEKLQLKFGKADEVRPEVSKALGEILWVDYYFYSKGIKVSWHADKRVISEVTLSK